MTKRIGSALLAALFLILPGSTQESCSTLSITTEVHPTRPLQRVTVDVTGSTANMPVFLAVGPTAGETTIDLQPLGTLVLGLERPFSMLLLGLSDSNGDLSRSFTVSSAIDRTLFAQSIGLEVTLGQPPALGFCTSNVVSVEL